MQSGPEACNAGVSRFSRRESLGIASVGFAAMFASEALAQRESHRILNTRDGKIRGIVSRGVMYFKGIPYGASTGGSNRFLPPQAVEPWSGVRDAFLPGQQCPQANPDYTAWLDPSAQGEDCLKLNVWAPEGAGPNSKLPVMVWLHGGAFIFGSAGAALYDGGNLASKGKVIVVGVNHRLNIFGHSFFYAEGDERFASAGNVGHLDLVAALHWVNRNIGEFGGNAANVTIFGESGGGGKVNALLASPSARGLIHKAIVQSGSIAGLRSADHALELTDKAFDYLSIRRGDIASLQKVPAAQMVKCYSKIVADEGPGSQALIDAYRPTLDGVVWSDRPWLTGSPATSHGIPMIIGTNLHEAILWAGDAIRRNPADDGAFVEEVPRISVINKPNAEMVRGVVEASRSDVAEMSAAERLVRVATDLGFRGCAIRQSEMRVQDGGAAVFAYECRWKTPCFGGMWAPHGVEIPFVFDHQNYPSAWDGTDDDRQRHRADPHGVRFRVGAEMLGAWARFAHDGDPSSRELPWPHYELENRVTMIFNEHSAADNDPRPQTRKAVAAADVPIV